MKRKIQQTMEQAYTVRDWLNRVGGWVVRREAVHGLKVMGRGSWVVGHGSWVVGRGLWVVGRGSWVVGRRL